VTRFTLDWMVTVGVIAVALAMDAFAVAIGTGAALRTVTSRQRFRLAFHFGLFQAGMPVLGWALGVSVRHVIEAYDHWVAFALLAFVGGRMIQEGFENPSEEGRQDPTRGRTLVLLSVATSIDALAVGLSMAVLRVAIWLPAAVIGVVAAGFTLLGLSLGQWLGTAGRLRQYSEVIGGVVLVAIGVKILLEHGVLAQVGLG